MIAALVSIAIAAATGAAIVRALDPDARGARLASLAFPVGIGACALALAALSAFGIAWSRATVLAASGALFVIAAFVAVARGNAGAASRRATQTDGSRERHSNERTDPPSAPLGWAAGRRPPLSPQTVIAALAAIVVLAMLSGHALFATLAPPGEWDFWAIWGLKARVFHEASAIDWRWLERPANDFAHPDYPILVPLAYDFVAAIAGRWPEGELGLLFSAFAASILLFTASHLRESTGSPLIGAAGAAALAGPVLALPIGLADLPLLAFGTIALLELRSAAEGRGEARLAVASVALALAALTKNEGIALVAAAAIAILMAGGSKRWRLLVAPGLAAIAASSWIALRVVHGLGTDLFRGDVAGRFSAVSPVTLVRELANNPPPHGVFWLAAVAAIALGGARGVARERLILLAVAIQLAFFLGAYLVTPHALAWHVETSWPRLLGQLVAPVAFVALTFAGNVLRRE